MAEERPTGSRVDDASPVADSVVPQVIVRFFADSQARVCGRPIRLLDMEAAAEALALSAFMRPWLKNRIKEHILAGGTFENVDEATQLPRAVYQRASEDDISELAVKGELHAAQVDQNTLDGGKSRRGGGKTYHIKKEKLGEIKGKPKAVLEQLIAVGKTYFNTKDLEELPGINLRSFQSAMSKTLKPRGIIEQVDTDASKAA